LTENLPAVRGHQPLPPFAAYSGSRKPRLLLLGEAWGQGEESLKLPFVGEAGKLLWLMLGEAAPELFPELHGQATRLHGYGLAWVRERDSWLEAAGIGLTNVLAFRPPDNKLEHICGTKAEVGGQLYDHPAITKGKYLRPEYLGEIDRLSFEIASLRPNLILALGNTALWATLRATNIGSVRGSVALGAELGCSSGTKILPTYHPAGVLRQWSWRPVVVADLMKAFRQADFPEIRRPKRTVFINPTIEEVEDFTARVLSSPPKLLSPDIETRNQQIKCIGFAIDRSRAFVIPFLCEGKPGWNYWASRREEVRAWNCVEKLLKCKSTKVGQNFLYDLQYIMKMGIMPQHCTEDTMLLHHSLLPEMQKGLGFLGSIYTDEASWKLMARHRPDTEKRDE
jgi:uracil-DNA glycosylase